MSVQQAQTLFYMKQLSYFLLRMKQIPHITLLQNGQTLGKI